MNGVSLRAELALADYLSAALWPDDSVILLESGDLLLLESGSSIIDSQGLGTPSVLSSFSRGEYEDEDTQDTMPVFPRIIVSAQSAAPIQRTDLTCEVQMQAELQVSADDSTMIQIRETVGRLDNLILPLFDDTGASALNAAGNDPSGPFTAQFATPLDFGASSISNRSRTFTRTFTLYCSATL
jgi:hypothetical protein